MSSASVENVELCLAALAIAKAKNLAAVPPVFSMFGDEGLG